MLAVAIVALVLAVEPVLFRQAAKEAVSDDGAYLRGEAVTLWVTMNIVLAIPFGLWAAMLWDKRRTRRDASKGDE